MKTAHRIFRGDARDMSGIPSGAVHLVVTSPPYPMIGMWDEAFGACDPEIAAALARQDGWGAFEGMHSVLDAVWRECHRALAPGGFMCVNIGNATRTIQNNFCFYPNNARILNTMVQIGMTPLPEILWRKPTNAPNKFMGSGMLPAGAYVTYEHEYILIFRKGNNRKFNKQEKERRSESACFWEERNIWFSDLWTNISGSKQIMDHTARLRSASFPLEIPYRLINMYSLYEDTVLDPFAGTGTTLLAAAIAGRNSFGYERDETIISTIKQNMNHTHLLGEKRITDRINNHNNFIKKQIQTNAKESKHTSKKYHFPITSKQEQNITFYTPTTPNESEDTFLIGYKAHPALSPPHDSSHAPPSP